MHSEIKNTFEKSKVIVQNSESCQVINLLDVSFILYPDCAIETDTYKDNNAHDYLTYDSTHPDHSKDNMFHTIMLNL